MSETFKLLLWQKRQAALIYHFTSLGYLQEYRRRVYQLLGEADTLVNTATAQERDRYLEDPQWGHRNTVDNWTHSGPWGALQDLKKNAEYLVAMRPFEVYGNTGIYGAAHMLAEYSTAWMTPDEETKFKQDFEALCKFASRMDDILTRRNIDYLTYYLWWTQFSHQFARLPKLRVRTDVVGESGKVPPRTGVYVAQDDPNAGLQFGWTGSDRGHHSPLPDALTLNEIGLHALQFAGRDNMWFNEAKMQEFCMLPQYRGILTYGDPPMPGNGVSIGSVAEISRPCKWYYVELIDGEWDDEENEAVVETSGTLRATAGEAVPREGVWYTPALKGEAGTLRLKAGDRLPATRFTDWGEVIWYWQSERQR
jgi:hypothetical protein